MTVEPVKLEQCPECGGYCANVSGEGTQANACPGVNTELYQTRYRCAGHPLARRGTSTCQWEGVLAGSDERDPSCPSCGGWVEKVGAAQLRRVK